MEKQKRQSGPGRKALWAAVLVAGVAAALGGVYLKMRGSSGPTTAMGGSRPAKEMPELPAAADRWVNGAPVSVAASRGQVLFVEGWHPA